MAELLAVLMFRHPQIFAHLIALLTEVSAAAPGDPVLTRALTKLLGVEGLDNLLPK